MKKTNATHTQRESGYIWAAACSWLKPCEVSAHEEGHS